jgi:DNA (cytosine-5)-methyltransferase 1
MRYGSVCSGIEAASVAWESLGWKAAWLSEIEAFPSAVLAHHYPNVPNFGDMTKFKEWKNDDSTAIDVLVGGTPCQSFSIAGLRKGLDDPRGNLMLAYIALAAKYRPKWLVWENVPGVLSSNGGNDFAALLRGLGECGYGFAYRILDAQHFGVPQRRRRVFLIGCLGDWRAAAAVLFERQSFSGDSAPSRNSREKIATPTGVSLDVERTGTITASFSTRNGAPEVDAYLCIPTQKPTTYSIPAIGNVIEDHISSTMTKSTGSGAGETQNPAYVMHPIALAENIIGRKPENGGNHDGFTIGGPMYTLNTTGVHGVAQPMTICLGSQQSNAGIGFDQTPTLTGAAGHIPVVAPTLTASNDQSRSPQSAEVTKQIEAVFQATMAVRRLTPVECERLQGFCDHYSDVPWRGKKTSPDSLRYKALGNSMAVPVMKWIGERIQLVDDLIKNNKN